jgi:hypothetical protein
MCLPPATLRHLTINSGACYGIAAKKSEAGHRPISRGQLKSQLALLDFTHHFLFGRCVSADAAAVFAALLELGFRRTFAAAVAAFALVTSLFCRAILSPHKVRFTDRGT